MLPTAGTQLEILGTQAGFEDEEVEVDLRRTRREVESWVGGVHTGCA